MELNEKHDAIADLKSAHDSEERIDGQKLCSIENQNNIHGAVLCALKLMFAVPRKLAALIASVNKLTRTYQLEQFHGASCKLFPNMALCVRVSRMMMEEKKIRQTCSQLSTCLHGFCP